MDNERFNKKLVPVYGLIGVLALIIVKVYNTSFKGGKFTCDKYILNTYLYILLSLLLMSLQNIVMEQQHIGLEDIFGRFKGFIGLIIILVLVIGLMFILLQTNPRNVVLKHTIWLAFIFVLGLLAYPSYLKTIKENTVIATLMTTIGILITFTIVAFLKPEWISLSWGPTLVFLLISGMIGELCFYLFNKNEKQQPKNKMFAYFFIALFTIFILYDTKKIQVNAKICKESTVDYINESLNIVLDVLNLFQKIAEVQK
jgi:FtsH-binding integral membrane protein|uniref:Inhibitor of apoptosis-promoting Bax1 n=1 Tax=viral metagenome TaxID=1070528 RepID=A0A6C0J926_9ZZZZ